MVARWQKQPPRRLSIGDEIGSEVDDTKRTADTSCFVLRVGQQPSTMSHTKSESTTSLLANGKARSVDISTPAAGCVAGRRGRANHYAKRCTGTSTYSARQPAKRKSVVSSLTCDGSDALLCRAEVSPSPDAAR